MSKLEKFWLFMLGFALVWGFLVIGDRHQENVINMSKVCDKIGLEYTVKTNFTGRLTRIYVK